MIYTENTKKAIRLMYKYHNGQLDKSGLPYVFHPFTVAFNMEDEETCIVALLHDIVEDTPCTIEELEGCGFSNEVIEAIKCMTHDDSLEYFEYVKKLSENEIASKVKIADLKHNSDKTRLDVITEKDEERYLKYKRALDFLENKWRNND